MSMRYAVGQSLERRSIAMSDQLVVQYARASGDHNPIHVDEDAALRAGLPGRIVHGMLTMGMFTTVASGWAGGATNIIAVSCRFRTLVRLDDIIEISGTVTDVASDVVTVAAEIVNERREHVLSNAVVEFIQPLMQD
jgi:acyl dehydratase